MATSQFTFRVADLLKLIGTQTTGNVLITETKGAAGVSFKAQLINAAPAAGTMAAMDTPPDGSMAIDGCPFPPGCTNG